MLPAFASFDEPWAWMIRGLVEYGWPDGSRTPGAAPPGRLGTMDLSRFSENGGRDGVVLHVPAAAGGQVVHEDGTYHFVVKLADIDGRTAFVVRCPEANYLQEFAWDPANPGYVAGYVHQALTEFLPQFVGWRLQGGEITWAQRSGLPEFTGLPCSPPMARFVAQRLALHRRFDTGPAEGWWTDGDPGAHSQPGQPIAWTGGPIATAGGGGGTAYVNPNTTARELVKGAGAALGTMTVLHMVLGGLALVNALITAILYGTDYAGAITGNICFGVGVLILGGVALVGVKRYREVAKGPLPWVAIAYAGLVPVCCLFGLPVAIWALTKWLSEPVKSGRT